MCVSANLVRKNNCPQEFWNLACYTYIACLCFWCVIVIFNDLFVWRILQMWKRIKMFMFEGKSNFSRRFCSTSSTSAFNQTNDALLFHIKMFASNSFVLITFHSIVWRSIWLLVGRIISESQQLCCCCCCCCWCIVVVHLTIKQTRLYSKPELLTVNWNKFVNSAAN